jgi:Domain of unknown function (DUF1772)
MLAGELALTIAAVFTGAAIYINIAEQPARLQLDNRSLLAEWKPAYKRGYMMQACLAVVGGVSGLAAISSPRPALGARSPRPALESALYDTIFVIMPMYASPPEGATAETRMLERWGTLHAGRSALGLLATLIFLWAQGEAVADLRASVDCRRSPFAGSRPEREAASYARRRQILSRPRLVRAVIF